MPEQLPSPCLLEARVPQLSGVSTRGGDKAEGGRVAQSENPRRSTEGRAARGGPKATSATMQRALSPKAQSHQRNRRR
eukprot:11385682-Alexandrium_andersonii.AAC.1